MPDFVLAFQCVALFGNQFPSVGKLEAKFLTFAPLKLGKNGHGQMF